MRRSICLVVGLLACALAGCRTHAAPAWYPSEAQRTQFGRMVLIDVTRGPESLGSGVDVDPGTPPSEAGLSAGMATLGTGLTGGRGPGLDLGATAVAVVLLPIVIVVAAIVTAASNPTAEELAEAQEVLQQVRTGYRLARAHDEMARQFLNAARSEYGADIRLEAHPRRLPNGSLDLDALSARGVDAVVQIELVDVRTENRGSECGNKARFLFQLVAHANVLRASDGAFLFRVSGVYEDSPRTREAHEWAASRGAAVTAELRHGAGLLGPRLAEDLFAHYWLGARRGS